MYEPTNAPNNTVREYYPIRFLRLYRCTVHLDINVYVHQLMHLFISPIEQ